MFIIKPGTNILDMLKSKGHTSYTIRRDKTFGEATMQKFRKGGRPSWEELDKLVKLLHVSAADLIAYQTDDRRVFDLTGRRLDGPQPAQATQPQPVTTPPTAPDNLLQVQLSPDMIHNMDGAIRYGYSSDRVQYAIRAINTQIQQDIAAEKEKRRSCVQPAMSYTYDPYYHDAPPDDY